jgi:hypothetical protein
MADIKVLNRWTGEVAHVDESQVDLARQEGWSVVGGSAEYQKRSAEAAQYNTIDQQIIAAGEAGVGEITLGMVRPEYWSEDAAKRREHALAGRWIGGTVGAVAPILLSGGTGLAAKGGATAVSRAATTGGRILQAGRAISTITPAGALARGGAVLERTVAGKLASASPVVRSALSMGAAGAVEGGIGAGVEGAAYEYAQSQDLSKAAQAFAASGGIGTLLGGVTGGAFGGVSGKLQSSRAISQSVDAIDPAASQRILLRNSDAIKDLTAEMAANPRLSEPVFKALKIFEDITNEAQNKTRKLTDIEISKLKTEKAKLQNALDQATDAADQANIRSNIDNLQSTIDGGVKHGDLGTESVLKAYGKIAEDMQTPAFKSAISPDLHAKLSQQVSSTLEEIAELSEKAAKELDNQRILGSAFLKKTKDEQFLKMLGSNQTGLTALRRAYPTLGDDAIVDVLERELSGLKTETGASLLQPRGMMPASVDEILPGIQYQKAVVGNQIDDVINSVDKWVVSNAPNIKPRTDAFLSRLDEVMEEAKNMPAISSPWIKDFEKLRGKDYGFSDLWDFRNKMDAKYGRSAKGIQTFDPRYVELRNELDEIVLRQVDDVAKSSGNTVDTGALVRQQRALGQVEALAQYGVARDSGNQFFSLTDKLQGIGGGIMGSIQRGQTPDVGQIAMNTLGLGMLSGGDMESMAQYGAVQGAFALGSRAFRRRGASLIYNMLKSQKAVAGKIATGTRRAVTSNTRQIMGQGITGGMDWLRHKQGESTSEALGQHRDKLLGGIAEADHVMEVPETSAEAKALAELNRRRDEYLLTVFPEIRKVDPLRPKKVKTYTPSPVELGRYGRVYSLLHDPMTVYDRIEAGNLSKEEVDGLQAVYPDLYQDMKEEMYKVLESDVEINAQRRASIEMLLGMTGHTTRAPIMNQQPQQPSPSPKISTTKGLVQAADTRFELA